MYYNSTAETTVRGSGKKGSISFLFMIVGFFDQQEMRHDNVGPIVFLFNDINYQIFRDIAEKSMVKRKL